MTRRPLFGAVRLALAQLGAEHRAANAPAAAVLQQHMYCCRCGFSDLRDATSAVHTRCPRCYTTWFALKEEPKCAVNF